MKQYKIFLAVFVALVAIGCGNTNVQTTKTTDKDLSQYETFAYLPNSNEEVPGRNYNDEEVNAEIIQTINKNMEEAGYTLDRDNPDLLVLVDTETDREVALRREPMYARFPYAGTPTAIRPYYNPYYYRSYNTFNHAVGYDTRAYEYEEGTLVVNVIDREAEEVVWKGVASENIYEQSSSEAIQELVNAVFEEYPVSR